MIPCKQPGTSGASEDILMAVPLGKTVSGWGITAALLGVAAMAAGIFPWLGWAAGAPLGIIAILLGLVGLVLADEDTGKGLPVTGSVVGVLALIVSWYAGSFWAFMGTRAPVTTALVTDPSIEEVRAKAKAGPAVTVTELLQAYGEDAAKADETYKDHWCRVKGKVESTVVTGSPAPWSGVVRVTFKPDDAGTVGIVQAEAGPKVFFLNGPTPQQVIDTLARLPKGKEVTLGGRCAGWKEGDFVLLESPVLMD
jgi:hypothetical protein